jgi:hypothetical protein
VLISTTFNKSNFHSQTKISSQPKLYKTVKRKIWMFKRICNIFSFTVSFITSVADPDPPDPHVFGPPGSGSISQRYGSESGFRSGLFCHHAKTVTKTLISINLWLFFTFYLWKMMYMHLQKVISRKIKKLNFFFVRILKVNDENSRIWIH